MIDLLAPRLDYVIFLTSLAFVRLAILSFTVRGAGRPPVLLWLGLFALVQAAEEWLRLLVGSLGQSELASTVFVILSLASYLVLFPGLLVECDRRVPAGHRKWHFMLWVVALIAALLLFVAALAGWSSVFPAQGAVLTIGGAVWVTLALVWTSGANQARGRHWLLLTGLGLGVHAFADSLIISHTFHPFAPAVAEASSLQALGVGDDFLHLLTAATMMIGLWAYAHALHQVDDGLGLRSVRQYPRHFAILIAAILLGGFAATEAAGMLGDAAGRHRLLSLTVTAASAIDAHQVARLSGSPADLGSADFARLHSQLGAMRAANPGARFVYLMGWRGGEVVFLMDSEAVDSADFSLPGEAYAEASPELVAAFTSGRALIEGPLNDSWGDWVSGLAPIRAEGGNEVIAVLGIDLDATTWLRTVALYRLVGMLFVVGALALTAVVALQRHGEAAAQLAAEECRYRSLVEATPNCVQLVGADGHVLTVNRSGLAVLGRPTAEVVGVALRELWPADARPRLDAAMRQVVQGQRSAFEGNYMRPDGAALTFSLTLSPVENGHVPVRHYLCIWVDVTEHRRAEAQIEGLSRFPEENPEPVMRLTPEGALLYANKACSVLPELANIAFGQTVPLAWRERVAEAHAGGAGAECEVTYGSQVYSFRLVPILGVGYVNIYGRDITDRKRAAEALRLSEERYRELFERVPVGIYRTTPEGRLLLANPTCLHMLGYSSLTDLAALDLDLEDDERYPPSYPRAEFRTLAEQPGGLRGLEAGWRKRDGSIVILREHAIAKRDAAGTVLYYDGTLEDVTERTKAEADLREAQAMLLQAEKLASVGQLAAGVAHEINNPLGFINSNLASLDEYIGNLTQYIATSEGVHRALCAGLDGKAPREVADLAQLRAELDLDYVLGDIGNLIKESCDGALRVKKIVQDLRTFSRPDASEAQAVDLNAVLDSALNIVWNQLKYTCTLSKDYGDLPTVVCNSHQIGQVFVNLLINASQAISPDVPGEIRLRTYAGPGAVFVEVGDNGKGIAPEHLARIFEPFFTTKAVGQGTGLGLAITYGIIERHRGRIRVASEPGKGTTFTVELPLGVDTIVSPRRDETESEAAPIH
ncbi:MAG: PAS domain S-box protein [Chloroflexota bacterium]